MVWQVAKIEEFDLILNFLIKNDYIVNPPLSSFPGGIKDTLKMFFKYGEISYILKESEIIGFLGYTYGDPNENYKDKSILYIYLMFILEDNRGYLFKNCIVETLNRLQNKNITKIRFKSFLNNTYNNTLYSKFAKKIKITKNSQNEDCFVYEAKIEDLI